MQKSKLFKFASTIAAQAVACGSIVATQVSAGDALNAGTPVPTAQTNADSLDVQVHGFISQTASWSDTYNVGGSSREHLALGWRELGLNGSWRVSSDWLLSAEVLSRSEGQTDDGSLRLDYAVADYTVLRGENQLGVRFGKVKLPFGMFNDSRDVPHTRPSNLMAQSVYLEPIRDVLHSAPGVSLYGESSRDWGTFSWNATLAQPSERGQQFKAFIFSQNLPGQYAGRPSAFVQGIWEFDGGKLRLGTSLGALNFEFQPEAGGPPGFSIGQINTRMGMAALSAEYNQEDWSFVGEIARYPMKMDGMSPVSGASDTLNSSGYYLQLNRRMGSGWQAFARYDAFYRNENDRDGTAFATITGLPSYLAYSKDVTIGARFDPTPHWTLTGELHRVQGTVWLSGQENQVVDQNKDSFNLVLLQATYHF